jgi:hypothetical protein
MILHVQLAAILQEQDRKRGELLGNVQEAKLGLWSVRDVPGSVGKTVALAE